MTNLVINLSYRGYLCQPLRKRGIEGLIGKASHSFSQAKHREEDYREVEAFLRRLILRLILKLFSSPKAVIINSTHLLTDPRNDKWGDWGYNTKGKFYSYNLHG